MTSFPSNYCAPPHHSSPSSTPRQQDLHDINVPTLFDDLFSNNLRDLGDFGFGTRIVSRPRVPSRGIVTRRVKPFGRHHIVNGRPRHVRLGTTRRLPSQTASFDAFPQSLIHPVVAPQLASDALDDPYDLLTQPSATLIASSRPAVFDGGDSWSPVGPSAIPRTSPQIASFGAFPQTDVHPAVAPPLTLNAFDGTYSLFTHPSASVPTGSSSAMVDGGAAQAFLSGVENILIPTPSGLAPVMAPTSAPALASSPSLTWTNNPVAPMSGSLTGAPAPVVRPYGAEEGSSVGNAAADATTSVPAEPRQVPAPCCPYCQRPHPLVRVHDTIEWIRPGVMKMVLYFNWTSNAEAEAHHSWDPRGE